MARRIDVNIPTQPSYSIVIEDGLFDRLAQHPGSFGLDGRVVVITNDTLADLYGESLGRWFPGANVIAMPDGEQYKNLDTVRKLYDDLLACGADRATTILAFGGGVVGDTAGFVAATYMRGVQVVQAPTTLLSMVDSSVGGKVGVDLPQGKNLVGAFKQPQSVLIDTQVLATLPDQEWRCGMAEVIKHGLLADASLLDRSAEEREQAAALVARAVQVKVDIVQEDPLEKGVRAYLNLGHTFAQALEPVANYTWLHGDAVGVGLLAAAKLSHQLGMCEAELVEQVDAILAEQGLPRSFAGFDAEVLYEAMKHDKKWRDGVSRFVLLAGMNEPRIVENVDRDEVLSVMRQMGAN